MIIYLAHAKTNYASTKDGYVMALREAEHAQTLWSFHFANGSPILPIKPTNEDLSQHDQRHRVE